VLDGVIGIRLPHWLKPAGIVLLLIGGVVVLLCGGILSTPGIVPTEFAVRGLFRYVRNPMSLGAIIIMMLGLALFRRSPSIFLFSALLFFLLPAKTNDGYDAVRESPGGMRSEE
jgi:protein-S-isoprenylcysteine O-methyltransferase Ste14